jgi:hypothetical protein
VFESVRGRERETKRGGRERERWERDGRCRERERGREREEGVER